MEIKHSFNVPGLLPGESEQLRVESVKSVTRITVNEYARGNIVPTAKATILFSTPELDDLIAALQKVSVEQHAYAEERVAARLAEAPRG